MRDLRFHISSHAYMLCCISSISLPCVQPMTSELSIQADKKVCVSCGCMISSHTPWIIQEQEQKLSKLSKLGQAKWRLYDTLLDCYTASLETIPSPFSSITLGQAEASESEGAWLSLFLFVCSEMLMLDSWSMFHLQFGESIDWKLEEGFSTLNSHYSEPNVGKPGVLYQCQSSDKL